MPEHNALGSPHNLDLKYMPTDYNLHYVYLQILYSSDETVWNDSQLFSTHLGYVYSCSKCNHTKRKLPNPIYLQEPRQFIVIKLSAEGGDEFQSNRRHHRALRRAARF